MKNMGQPWYSVIHFATEYYKGKKKKSKQKQREVIKEQQVFT